MPSIYELVTANALSVYWTELNSNRLPYLGAALFPAKRMMGLKLSWIRGVNNLPVMLAPSAFDTKPTLRDRGGVNTFETKMPFFRESMRIGEEDRQQMLQLLQMLYPERLLRLISCPEVHSVLRCFRWYPCVLGQMIMNRQNIIPKS